MNFFQSLRHGSSKAKASPLPLSLAFKRTLMRIHLTILAIVLACLQVTANNVLAQNINLNAKNTPLKTVLQTVSKQTGFQFFYKNNSIAKGNTVTLKLNGTQLKEALEQIFKDQPLSYEIVEKTIVVTEKPGIKPNSEVQQNITGKVTNERGDPLPGVTVTVKGTSRQTATDSKGNFTINANTTQVLVFSFLGYTTVEQEVQRSPVINVTLVEMSGQLDQVQVIAYGTTTRRLNTGSVGTISAKDIANQPVSNPLAAMIGRVPGLVVTQQSGVPGSSFSVQIRGRNSIAQGSQPLILIDGIPFAAANENVQMLNSAINNFNQGSGVSPFNTINPTDIESIEVLKDADATAIYGSRGANGVVLITTKKGKAGKTQISATFNQGIAQVGKLLPLLNTEEYIAMRKEAFANAATNPTISNAPDLLVFDQNRYTDYQREFLGGTGHTSNANLSLSGGSSSTQFLLSGTYYRETSVFPGSLPNQRGSMLANINHTSDDKRFNVSFSGNFTTVENRAPSSDLTFNTFLSPNTPDFFDTNGKLQWTYNGVTFQNPYAYLRETYTIRTNNLAASLNASYKIWNGFSAKVLMGYNQQFTNEKSLSPADAKSPTSTTPGHSADFAKNQFTNWNIEPQLDYTGQIWKGKLSALVGMTFLSRGNDRLSVSGTGYSSEALLENFDAAAVIDATSASSLYRYNAVFGRINYNLKDKYLINFTGRRDGSSRFGPGKQFANFGAIGAAWIFSSEKWFNDIPFLSFGKIRGSYGVTGNDQIGDYQFVETWNAPSNNYAGSTGLVPSNLYNADYAWERNRKLEAAIDLGLLKDKVLLSVGYFQNRSGNQLVSYKIPAITGFTSVLANFPAEVENKGWELTLSGSITKGKFHWSSNLNLTFPKNVLRSFPGIQTSAYNSAFVVGQSLNSIYNYKALGVNTQTGLLQFLDANNDNSLNVLDYQINGNLDPKFYGGWQNTFTCDGFEVQLFFDFKKQLGRDPIYYFYGVSIPAGTMRNIPEFLNERWKTSGDMTDLPKISSANAGTQASNTANSSFAYSDQSFIRLRNLSISYALDNKVCQKIGAKYLRIYLQGQNLLTFNHFKGYDPETQNPSIASPLKTYNIGLQISY
ncbi:SusC/RagA family TonB-linked outer membrane protein [Pedobacter sp.]